MSDNERARLINWAKQLADPNWCLSVPKEAKDVITQLVKELEPRTIMTVEELDALPGDSAIRSAMGVVYVKDYEIDDPYTRWWMTAGAVSEFQSSRIALPATVLHEPEASL